MKLFIPFLVTLMIIGTNVHAQKKDLPVTSSSFRQLVENEKQSFSHNAANRADGTIASENFDINFYRCEWSIDPAIRYISGKVTSYFKIVQATDNITFDLSDTLTVDSVTYKNMPVTFQRITNDGLQIKFPAILTSGQKDSLSVYYHGVPKVSKSFQAFLQTIHSGVPVIATNSEPYGAKQWWPCKNGLTDKADSLEVIITSPSAYRGISNGTLVNEEISGPNKVTHFKHRYPIASYLVAMAVTNYVTDKDSVEAGNKFLPLAMNSYPEDEDFFKAATFYAKQSILKFTELFGQYPFINEQYSQTDCDLGGGMENQTNSFIGDNWNQLVAHELGHQWFGDHITCGSWQHIWLNEGFANYMQYIYVQNFDTSLIRAHLSYYLKLVTSLPDGSVFVPDTTDPARVFDARLTYAKGGYTLHMLRGILGDSLFFKSLRQYLGDPLLENKFATTPDFERNVELATGRDFKSFFQKWIYGQGYPNYNCTWMQNTNNWAKIQMNQTTSHPSVDFYEMPVRLRFKNSLKDTTVTVNNQQNGETFWVNLGFQADTMMIDPDYWILAKDRISRKIPAQSTVANDIKIYPNPTSDHLNVLLLNPVISKIEMQLYNAAGQMMYDTQKSLTGSDDLTTIPTARLAKGIYVLKISENKIIKAQKIIIN